MMLGNKKVDKKGEKKYVVLNSCAAVGRARVLELRKESWRWTLIELRIITGNSKGLFLHPDVFWRPGACGGPWDSGCGDLRQKG